MKSERLVNLREFEEEARRVLPKDVFEFYAGGADDEVTARENQEAFGGIRLKARALMNADSFKGLECSFLGYKVGTPVGIAPAAFHQLACGEGEMATVKAAESMNTVVCISSMSNIPIEELAHASPSSLKILQVYLSRLDDLNQEIFKRAKDAGFKGIALTVDSNILGN